jgi:hypothetical protein
MLRKYARLIATLVLTLLPAIPSLAADIGVQITQLPDRLRVEINGHLFTEYFYTNVARPYYYPLLGPDNLPMTRKWPMENPPGEEHDHLHHRSLWFAHGAVNGQDFWTEGAGTKIVHQGFDEIKSSKDVGIIKSHDNWVATDGRIFCTDDRVFKVYNPGAANERVLDFEITLHASHGDLLLGDSKEGTMAVRVAESMKLKGKNAHGHIYESTGDRDAATWGKRADWCDYNGPVNGKIVGIAMFDNPKNPRHPTWWHVRDYGLFAANPFGKHEFESLKDKKAGDLKVPAGESITFRYRLFLHEGDQDQAKVADRYQEYVRSVP